MSANESEVHNVYRLEELIVDGSEGDIAPLADSVVALSLRHRASDIHIEPSEDSYVIRIRVDGRLEKLSTLSREVGISLVSRYKVLARLNIVERRRPQDGQFSVDVEQRQIDVRLSTVATLFGEKAELRVLDTRRELSDANELGMTPRQMSKFEQLIKSQYGLVVAAGPTGAGKTTTLHTALRLLNTPDRNVVTIEDPVEYVLAGVNHLPVHDDINVSFAVQLRAILRQDPDTILVGETRDAETARISIQAALAGRLVLTSIHATDVVAAIYRLFQMGIEPHLIAASLSGVISQRLIRRICDGCKFYDAPTDAERTLLRANGGEPDKVIRSTGCAACRGTGFYGRLGVFQILEISHDMREAISRRPEPHDLARLAFDAGVRSLPHEAYDIARAGLTTVSEAALLAGVDV